MMPVWQIFSLSDDLEPLIKGNSGIYMMNYRHKLQTGTNIRYRWGYIPHQHEFRAQEHKNGHSWWKKTGNSIP